MKVGSWVAWLVFSLLFVAGTMAYALTRDLVALVGLPLGFLFGFFLHKGDLCGASAFSEVLLMRDRRKVWGMWVCIVTSMVVFSAMDFLGLVKLAPKPMLWLSYLVGGAVFGAGTVLAGGCVSGCLYKGPAGNLNSIVALMGMPLGMAMVEYGPLAGLNKVMAAYKVSMPDGSPVTLSSLTGLPFGVLAVLFAVLSAAAALWWKRAHPSTGPKIVSEEPLSRRLFTRPWKPWQAGLAIGLLAGPLYLSSASTGRNYPVGVTHGVLHAYLLATEPAVQGSLKSPAPRPPRASANPGQGAGAPQAAAPSTSAASQTKKVSFWLVFVVLGLMLGAHVSARMGGTAKLLPKEPQQTLLALLGGVLVGMGAWIATGCVIGNILSGWALMSVGLLLFGAATILSNWAVTWIYLMGGWSGRE